MPMHESSCIVDPSFFVVSLFCCQLVSLFFDCLPWSCTHTVAQVCALFTPSSSPCFTRVLRPLRLLYSLHLLSLHLSYLPALPAALHLLLPWCREIQPRALPLRSWVTRTKRTPPQVMSPTTTSSRRLMSSTPRSPWPSNGSLKTSTTMTTPSVRRSSMRAEDEPITLKKKACRPVCRRQSVMIERWDPLFADLCRAPKKLRDTTLRMNRLGLSFSDK